MSAPILLGGQLDKLPGSVAGLARVNVRNFGCTFSQLGGTTTASFTSPTPGASNEGGYDGYWIFGAKGVIGNAAECWFDFFGGTLGLSYLRKKTTGDGVLPTPFDVVIDGVVYPVLDHAQRQYNIAQGTQSLDVTHIIATNLGPGPHQAQIIVQSDPLNTATTRQLRVWSLILEKSAGYRDSAHFGVPIAPIAVPTVAAAISLQQTNSPDGYGTLRALRRIKVYNSAGTATTITVVAGNTSTAPTARIVATKYLAAAGTTGDSDEIVFDTEGIPIDATWTIVASQAGAFYMAIGAN